MVQDFLHPPYGLGSRVSENEGYHFGGPYDEEYIVLGSTVSTPSGKRALIGYRDLTLCDHRF